MNNLRTNGVPERELEWQLLDELLALWCGACDVPAKDRIAAKAHRVNAMMPALIATLQDAERKARELGLID